jgi:hypothetical protein
MTYRFLQRAFLLLFIVIWMALLPSRLALPVLETFSNDPAD